MMYNFRVGRGPKRIGLDMIKLGYDYVATRLLTEYKDMLPSSGKLKDVAAINHYKKSHIFKHAFKWKHVFVFNKESCGTVILGVLKKVKLGTMYIVHTYTYMPLT